MVAAALHKSKINLKDCVALLHRPLSWAIDLKRIRKARVKEERGNRILELIVKGKSGKTLVIQAKVLEAHYAKPNEL